MTVVTTLPDVRERLRAACDRYSIPLETRGRLVVAVTAVAKSLLTKRIPVELGERVEAEQLVVSLRAPMAARPDTLPLMPEHGPGGTFTWRIPISTVIPAPSRPVADETAFEQELMAALAHADAVERQQKDLKHELAETNSGVLAMYVELEKRDEQLRRSHAVIFRQLEDALRPQAPSVPGVGLAVHYAPADADAPTGGDLFDWFVLPDGMLHITVVDAVGHGVASTRDALDVTHAIRTLALEGHPLAQLIGRAAETLGGVFPRLMATALVARIDPSNGRFQLANGGHPPALLLGRSGACFIQIEGRGVGFPLPGSVVVHTGHLETGDVLLLYTDGLTECRGSITDGEQRLVKAALRHKSPDLDAMTSAIVADIHEDRRYADDTLLITVRYGRRPSA
ncbi:PP2C family protein-serine/threonine phosphatase [Kibdelosporangium phytohabitans]|uniref:PPM-type phosphatase domain-containing protein n=1 Tax=Kibdelosporangium phytohabitans TaxID=860235 RepID=A0A0N9I6J0_9PSEU|nr:PP2C family protein-serine/threonine phosphatase [Kibdelosporangium phytohabitans]ALG11812.1 hypothetical protein AOZ06_37465 [Kibdelosporangium phytohabitans]MBE1463225.1 serine phosphatase RsbU (regulator of sigma subunit) [Kibdelosporangium phytohabitans]